MTPRYITTRGSGVAASSPYYIGHVQHDRAMSRREAYEYLSQQTGFRPAQLRAAFLGLARALAANAARGNISTIDGVASFRIVAKGSFESVHGPWRPGVNMLVLNAFEQDPFKGALSGFVPVNRTEGAKPVINTVFDETARVYDEIAGTNLFSIAGNDLAPDANAILNGINLSKDGDAGTKIAFLEIDPATGEIAEEPTAVVEVFLTKGPNALKFAWVAALERGKSYMAVPSRSADGERWLAGTGRAVTVKEG